MKNNAKKFASLLAKPAAAPGFGGAELVLAAFVVSVVAMMIVPLPTWLLDLLLATNLSLAVAILLIVLYVPDVLAIAAFPTLLLLTTLFRLALNVSSVRLILLQANAGEVIKAFGNFVVRGNYVVGGVVFLVLTVIQFIVIAKGSERVAEVAARFVLDAMPGKQMSIDAELRAGSIDGAEARRRRNALSRESQFFGSMDGAMKYVKGDVICALVICVINIVGGLAIGVGQRNMSAVDALKKFGLLTIGDGLVSQIPALVLSMAAGVLVTRTASEEPDMSLGKELSKQLFGMPKALQATSVFLGLLVFVPGLPGIPFGVLAVLLFVAARVRSGMLARDDHRATTEPTPKPAGTGAARGQLQFIPRVVPWTIEVSEDLSSLLEEGPTRPSVRSIAGALRESIFAERGVPLPPPHIRVNGMLPPRHAHIAVFEIPAKILPLADTATDEEALAEMTKEASQLLHNRAADFLGLAETQKLIEELEQFAPAVVRNVIGKPISLPLLVDILRRLVEERVSIRDLRTILESLARASDKDPLTLTEHVRGALRRAITHKLTQGAPFLNIYALDPAIEEVIRASIAHTADGSFLQLPLPRWRQIASAIRRAIVEGTQKLGEASNRQVVILNNDVTLRRFVRLIARADFPDAVVTNHAELLTDISLRPIAHIHLDGLDAE